KLHRSAIGCIQLNCGNNPPLPLGDYRFLTLDELKYLKNQIN
ncbi:MAG: pseudouridine synthase, partial [Microcystis aeruginosa]